MRSITRSASICFGSGSCTRMPLTAGSALSAVDERQQLGFAGRCRQVVRERAHADRLRRPALVAHVDLRRGVVADQHDGESGRGASRGDVRGDVGANFVGDALRDGLAVDDAGASWRSVVVAGTGSKRAFSHARHGVKSASGPRHHAPMTICGQPLCRACAASTGSAFTATGCVTCDRSGRSFCESL